MNVNMGRRKRLADSDTLLGSRQQFEKTTDQLLENDVCHEIGELSVECIHSFVKVSAC